MYIYIEIIEDFNVVLGGCADKYLARPGRLHATATELDICLTYSPRSTINFLTHCSIFCKSFKKIQKLVCPTRSPRQQWPPCLTKSGELSIVFSVQGTGCFPTGPDPENRVCDKENGRPGRSVFSVLQVQVELRHYLARTRPLDEILRVFPFRMFLNCTRRDV